MDSTEFEKLISLVTFFKNKHLLTLEKNTPQKRSATASWGMILRMLRRMAQ